MSISYEAVNENPRVFCSYGETPAKALKAMSKLLKENDVDWWSSSSVGYLIQDNLFYITVYV